MRTRTSGGVGGAGVSPAPTQFWGRYALFRGHPRISGLLMWDAPAGQVVVAGERGGQKFEELSAPRQPYRSPITPVAVTARDTSRTSAPPGGPRQRAESAAPEASRSCERCGEPLPAGLRAEARYCSKRCRQAASRARVKDRPPSPRPPSLPAAQPRRGLRVVRRADAHWPESGGTILLQAVPAGVLPARPQGPPQLPEDLEPT